MRKALWVAWCVLLLGAPTGLLVVHLAFPNVPTHPPPWPEAGSLQHRLADSLGTEHLALSATAFVLTPFLTRNWGIRLAAWAGIVVWAVITGLFALTVALEKTGMYF